MRVGLSSNVSLEADQSNKKLTVNGGDNDSLITNQDAVFMALRLGQDVNHNGISEPSELKTLPSIDLTSIELDYKESRISDDYGNNFRYRAKVKDRRGGQWGRSAWDMFLVSSSGNF